MKIAQIAPPFETVPPKKYGGTERVVSELTEQLVAMGHDVTLFASGDSITSAKLVSTFPKGIRELYPHDMKPLDVAKRTMAFMEHISNVYYNADSFDIIHDHTSLRSMPISFTHAQYSNVPVVTTLHSELNSHNIAAYSKFSKPYLVAISHAQAKLAPQLNYVSVVYNGLDMHTYPFNAYPKKYLLFVGRISRQKGVHNAITVAQKTNLPLIIAAKLDESDKDYFEEKVKPYLNDKIRWIGEVEQEERNKLMSNALCFLHPLEWEEPFGLTIIESMACGTPVVAFDKGSMKELISSGRTGYVVQTIDEMIQSIHNISKINRFTCHSYARERFSAKKMGKEYEIVYETIVAMQHDPFSWFIQPSLLTTEN